MEIEKLSSLFVSLPAVIVLFAVTVLCFYFSITDAALACFLLFLFTGAALLWCRSALRKLSVSAEIDETGVFPGETLTLSVRLSNKKLLPLVWTEVLFPLPLKSAVLPLYEKNLRSFYSEADEADHPAVSARLSWLLWYQEAEFSVPLCAVRRGIVRIPEAAAASGDGFGLGIRKKILPIEPSIEAVVFPEIIPVHPAAIINSVSDTENGRGGWLEDVTLLRSARSYLDGDPARAINMRILAGQDRLETNIYETISPKLITFLPDLMSFTKKVVDENTDAVSWTFEEEAFEEMLSLTASLIVKLSEEGASAGLLVPSYKGKKQSFLPPGNADSSVMQLLYRLSDIDFQGGPVRQPAAVLQHAGAGLGTICVLTASEEERMISDELLYNAGRVLIVACKPSDKEKNCPFRCIGKQDLI